MVLAATTGLRRSEVLGLRWRDVDLERGRVTVNQVLVQIGRRPLTKKPKTKRSRRTVSLPQVTIEALRTHKNQHAQERLMLGLGRNPDTLVFTKADGDAIVPQTFTEEFARIVAAAEVRRVTFHGLRHTHLTHLLAAGVNPKVASERAGHSSVKVTLDTYSHVIPGMQDDVAEAIDQAFRPLLKRG